MHIREAIRDEIQFDDGLDFIVHCLIRLKKFIPASVVCTPVPAGLGHLSKAQRALAELYGLSDALIAAAALESPPVPGGSNSQTDYEE